MLDLDIIEYFDLEKYFFFVRYSRVEFWAIVDEAGPDEEPNTAEKAKDVEDGLPAQVLAEVAGDRQGDDGTEGSPGQGEGGEPDQHDTQLQELRHRPEPHLLLSCGAAQRAIIAYMAGTVTPVMTLS